jgi:hypothetical protein
LDEQKGIQRLLLVILETTGTGNGFDSLGHYLRTFLTVPVSCLRYAVTQETASCYATLKDQPSAAASTTTMPPADALTAGATATGTDASLVDEPAPASTDAPTTTAPAGSGVLNYLLGGSGEK